MGSTMTRDQLEPIEPAEAVELYFSNREPELSEKTLENQRYRLDAFLEWCEEAEIKDMNALTGRDLHRFRTWRAEDIKPVTLSGHLQTFRKFLEFCAAVDAVPDGMREKVHIPNVEPDEEARDEHLDPERARAILEYLEKFQYASRDHVIFTLLWHTGIRLGTLRTFDVDDFDADAQALLVRHRPESDTPLKNKSAAERSIAVGEYHCEVLTDYIQHHRHTVEDDYGRSPLITSTHGRLSSNAIREIIYQLTRPCMIQECPHDRDEETCEAMNYNEASKCPSSRSPHGIRRGAITEFLREGTPPEVVSERMNVTKDVLDQHYDARTEREKMEYRREYIEDR
jgi:site-specific recombinase XerD